jgi:hypothetical protein
MAQRSNRRFLNLISEEVFEDRVSYIGRGRADSIMARSLGLHLRPNTLAQTKPSSLFSACNSAADHTFR